MLTIEEDALRARRWGELLCRAAAGDRAAFAELAAELKPYLLGRLRRCPSTRELFHIPDDAEDAVQDALLAVWQRRAAFDPARCALAWIWVICRNCGVDILRRRSRHRAISLYDRDGRLLAGLAVDPVQPSALASAAEQQRHLRRAVARALWDAEPRVRQAWRCRILKGQSYEVIARRLGVPQGTVATWLHRFKQALRTSSAARGRTFGPAARTN
jgi:RNA polymerase sigma-70 factor (ECF subfamily)